MRIAVALVLLAGCAAAASCNSVEVAPILDDAGAAPADASSDGSSDAPSDASSDAPTATEDAADAADAA
jgi:hypothetical protein